MSDREPLTISRRKFGALTLGMGAALMLGEAGTATFADAATNAQSRQAEIQKIGTLKIAVSRAFTGGLDPGIGGSVDSDASLISQIFSSLTTIGPNEKLTGDLATSWKQTSQTSWQFTIRQGVKYSNGDPLTAADIVYSIERVINPANAALAYHGIYAPTIASATSPNPQTVIITTNGPYLELPAKVSTLWISQQAFLTTHNPKLQALGSGPYQVVSYDPEGTVSLTANPNYYRKAPTFKNVNYIVLAAEASRVSALQAGEINLAINLDPDDLPELTSSGGLTVGSGSSVWSMVIRFNEAKPPLNNLNVRLALNYAVNKAEIAKALLGSKVVPSPGQPLNPQYEAYNKSLTAYPYNPAKAKQLLAAAGYAKGLTLELDVPAGTYVAGDSIAQAVQADLQAVGVKINIVDVPFATWVANSYSATAAPDLEYIGYSQGYPSVPDKLAIYESTYTQSHYDDPQLEPSYDSLVAKAQQAPTLALQQQYINQATKVLHNHPPVIFLFPQPLTYAYTSSLQWVPRPEHWLRAYDVSVK